MALDAVAIKAVAKELQILVGGRVDKVHQPERDEIAITVRTFDASYKLLISASAAHPRTFKKKSENCPLILYVIEKTSCKR